MTMDTVIVCTSVSHGNTRRIADRMARVLGAEVLAPEQADPARIAEADLVGFGSGVFHGRLHPRLTGFAKALPQARGRAFVFATSGLPELPPAPFTRPLSKLLAAKGFEVTGSFTCRAYDTWAPFRLVGGLHRHRPDDADLSAAGAFAGRLLAGQGPAD
ncbi:flavodoxin family protein [Kitasatospora sp. NPDC002227]|uniref:flavodoxin family protein n=1 Tax=Kitasatospora sp. NPDC002227 TaxID=3154773 RepID=UPI00332AF127